MRSIEWRHSCALVTLRCACILYCSIQEATNFRAVVSNSMFRNVYYLAVQLFTSAVTWDPSASPSLWGPEVKPYGHFVDPGTTERFGFNWRYPKQLRIFKQPFAIGGMRLAYCALDTETGRRHASHLLETGMSSCRTNRLIFDFDGTVCTIKHEYGTQNGHDCWLSRAHSCAAACIANCSERSSL